LSERAEVIAAVAALGAHALAGLPGECFEDVRCNARPEPFERTLGPLCVGVGLIADGLELRNAVLEHRVREIGNAVLDRVVEPLEIRIRIA